MDIFGWVAAIPFQAIVSIYVLIRIGMAVEATNLHLYEIKKEHLGNIQMHLYKTEQHLEGILAYLRYMGERNGKA
jgi:hypothetical protein